MQQVGPTELANKSTKLRSVLRPLRFARGRKAAPDVASRAIGKTSEKVFAIRRQIAAGAGSSRGREGNLKTPFESERMADDLKDEIRENASGPAKASGDAGSVEQHKLSEQIAADKHLASKDGVGSPHRGLRFNKIVPPAAG